MALSYQDTLTQFNTVYHNSVSVKELWEVLDGLDRLMSNGQLLPELKANAEALYFKLVVKIRLLEYLKDFDKRIYDDAVDFIETQSPIAEKRAYNNSLRIMTAADRLFTEIKNIVSEADAISSTVSEGASAELARTAEEAIEKLVQRAEYNSFYHPFGEKVVFVDIAESVFGYIEKVRARINGVKKSDLQRKAHENFKEISKACTLSEYFPIPEYDEGGRSNAVILCTPFADEALLYAAHAGREGKTVYTYDALRLETLPENEIVGLMETAAELDYDVIMLGSGLIAEGKRSKLYESAMRAGKNGIRVFIHDTLGDGKAYESCLKTAAECGLSANDISVTFVTMPAFADVCREFEDKGIISGPVDYDKLKEMPFMGFTGLNKVVNAFIAGADWYKTGKKISKYNYDDALSYLGRIKSSYLLLDSGWGDYSSNDKINEERDGEFDYDGVKKIDLENVRRIVECGHSVFAKCGMIVRYCTLGGGDITDWDKLEREEMSERVDLATKLVFRLLKVDIVPQVEILDELENSTAGGLCYDGGKRIVYKYSCCKSLSWMLDSIVHESFHAMQSKLCRGGWSEWYFKNLGIARGRVERWNISRQIYNSNTNSDVYKVHIYENDAYAFQIDCDDGRNYAWNTIDLV